MKNFNPVNIPILDTVPPATKPGQVGIYFKKDGLLYKVDSSGAESAIEDVDVFSPMTMELTNRSGGDLVLGNVVILDTANPLSVTTISANFSKGVVGVIKEGGADGEKVLVQFAGVADILMDAQIVNIGNYIYSSTFAGKGFSTTSTVAGCFARALTAKPFGVEGLVKGILAGGLPELF